MRLYPLISLSLFAFVGCRESDVHVYRIAKEKPGAPAGLAALMEPGPEVSPAEMPMAPNAGGERPAMASAGGEAPDLPIRWKVPKEWKVSTASGMRLASFAFAGADISVIAIPGEAGGDLANVNRWRGQLGLQPIGDREMPRVASKLKTSAGSVLVVDLIGTDPKGEIPGKARMLGAILALGDQQWFFKAMGTEKAVAQAKPSFMSFLRSLKRASNS